MKQCTKRRQRKDKSEFSKNRKNKDGLSNWYKKCKNKYDHDYYKKDGRLVKKYLRYDERHRFVKGVKQK